MNRQDLENLNTNENNDDELENEEEEEECQYIDPNDIIIIQDGNNWRPEPKYIASYANQLGFDPEKDPKELISIAEKYLTIRLPDNIKRAFLKNDLHILYIDMLTQEIKISSEIEEQAKEEFEKIREQFKNRLKQNSKDAPSAYNFERNNKDNLININDIKRNTDDELKKKLEEQLKYMNNEKSKKNDDYLNLFLNDSEDKKEEENENKEEKDEEQEQERIKKEKRKKHKIKIKKKKKKMKIKKIILMRKLD